MGIEKIPLLELDECPFEHINKCPQNWKSKFIDHKIICKCSCHNKSPNDPI